MKPVTINFPIGAERLMNDALERFEEHSGEIATELRLNFLPQAIQAIFNQDPTLKPALDRHLTLNSKTNINQMAQILWSNPGRLGGEKIEEILKRQGLSDLEADAFAMEIIHMTRYPISVANFLRQMRSAIVKISELLNPEVFRLAFFRGYELPTKQINLWERRGKELREKVFKAPQDISEWLNEVGEFYNEISSIRFALREGQSIDDAVASTQNRRLNAISVSHAQTRRYGRFLYSEFKNLKGMGHRYERDEDSLSYEFDKLKSSFDASDSQLYKTLKEYYQKQNQRFAMLTPERLRSLKQNQKSQYEKILSHKLNLDGRELEIKVDSDKLSPSLIENFLRLYKLQLDIDPNMKKFEGSTSLDGATISISLDQPSSKDFTFLKKFLSGFSKRVEL